MSEQRLSPAHIAITVLICTVWGGNFIAAANGLEQFPPFLFMTLRFLILLLACLAFIRRPAAGQWGRLIMVCLFMGSVHFSFLFWAIGRSSDISSVAILQQIYIPLAVLLAIFLTGEKVGARTLFAVALAFAGVLVVGLDPLVMAQMDVVALVLVSALFQALGSIYQRGITGMGVLSFQAWAAVVSLPVMFSASLLFEDNQFHLLQTARWSDWTSLAYSALLASLVGHGLFFFLVQRNTVSSVMPYLTLQPVMAVLFGVLIWGDQLGWRLMLGGSIILGSILFITLRARDRTVRAQAG